MSARVSKAAPWCGSLVLAGLVLCYASACSRTSPAPVGEKPSERVAARVRSNERVQTLRRYEAMLRRDFDPSTRLPWLDVSGANPYRLAQSADGYVGILAGSATVVELDASLAVRRRLRVADTLGDTPTALCTDEAGHAWIGSRYTSKLLRLQPARELEQVASVELPVLGVADVACGAEGRAYLLPADGSSLLTLDAAGRVVHRFPALPGGLRLLQRGRHLLELSLFERTLRVLELSAAGMPERELTRIVHDGPMWAADAIERDGALFIAVTGVEDKPLIRVHGEFENIDSFAWVYRFASALTRVAELNVSDSGVILPKAVALREQAGAWKLTALGAGSGRSLTATWPRGFERGPELETEPVPPGASDAVFGDDGSFTFASPLLDAWVRVERAGVRLERVEHRRAVEPEALLGEALFFTELVAPDNDSAGAHSRFTCETCHFEGGVDGRTHFTGRGRVSVVTKPLFGLANNRPHFSRAMDPDLSSVSHNEFRVAGAGSGTDPWFTLDSERFPWLRELGIARARLSPLELRQALLSFLYAFEHPPSPSAAGRARFTPLEAAGAALFNERCVECHAARTLSDEPQSAIGLEGWEPLIFRRNAPLVWARGDYEKTGVLPYVHERGTRITSLRRLALKPRFFTSGSAPNLEQVLLRYRTTPSGGLHEASPEITSGALGAPERRALLAFLRLL
jgi:hypothetical protein